MTSIALANVPPYTVHTDPLHLMFLFTFFAASVCACISLVAHSASVMKEGRVLCIMPVCYVLLLLLLLLLLLSSSSRVFILHAWSYLHNGKVISLVMFIACGCMSACECVRRGGRGAFA